eukprot:jgi/Mesvir1/7021/Mv09151-RA.1
MASSFEDSVRQRYAPAVMVIASPDVEIICQKSGLTFVDILRPYYQQKNINVPVRTCSDYQLRLNDFSLAIYSNSEVHQYPNEVSEEYLTEVVNSFSADASNELQGHDPSDIDYMAKFARNGPAPWFQKYCKEFWRTLAFSDHETLDHPVACILAIHSGVRDPVNQFVQMYAGYNLPRLLADGIMDPNLLKHFVLVHDANGGVSKDRADEILREMQASFGVNNCTLLPLNSNVQPAPREDIWSPHRPKVIQRSPPVVSPDRFSASAAVAAASPGSQLSALVADMSGANASTTQCGAYLSDDDLSGVSKFMAELTIKLIVPHMEQKIRLINAQIASTRKGLKNQLKSLWYKKEKKEGDTSVHGGKEGLIYQFTSMESQLRVLADMAFMIRDYELALSTYRLVAGDYKTDRAWRHYAGTQEMTGLCLFMLDPTKRECEAALETAYTYYQRCGASHVRYATRAMLTLVAVLRARSLHKDAALGLIRASHEETSLRVGLLLEQAGFCFLSLDPPLVRKYAFNLVLAGHRYNQCFQRRHAVRAYSYVEAVYWRKGWSFVDDHISNTLGRQAAHLGDFKSAVRYFQRMLHCPHQPESVQATTLREFLYVHQQAIANGCEVDPFMLRLPDIAVDRIYVHFDNHICYGTEAAHNVPAAAWAALEEPLVGVELAEPSGLNWLERSTQEGRAAAAAALLDPVTQTNVCVAGEEIGVDVHLANPLKRPIDVMAMRLVCTFTANSATSGTATGKTGSPATANTPNGQMAAVGAVFRHQGAAATPDGLAGLAPSGSLLDTPPADGLTFPAGAPGAAKDGGGDQLRPDYVAEEATFTMKGEEKMTVRLKVRPGRAGRLRIMGVRWLLAGSAEGQCTFQLKSKKTTKLSRSGKSSDADRPPHQRLAFQVLEAMPRLEATLHELPPSARHGELRRLVLELSNRSPVSLTGLALRTSHPAFFCGGRPGDLDAELPAALTVNNRPETSMFAICETMGDDVRASTGSAAEDEDLALFQFPNGTLEGYSTIQFPMWFRAATCGSITFSYSLAYRAESASGASAKMPYRILRMASSLQVMPSLRVRVRTTPSSSDINRYLVQIDVHNAGDSDIIRLRQVSALPPAKPPGTLVVPAARAGSLKGWEWVLSPLEGGGISCATGANAVHVAEASQLLQAGEATSLYFHARLRQTGGGPSLHASVDWAKDGMPRLNRSAAAPSMLLMRSLSRLESGAVGRSNAAPSILLEPNGADPIDVYGGPISLFHGRERAADGGAAPPPARLSRAKSAMSLGRRGSGSSFNAWDHKAKAAEGGHHHKGLAHEAAKHIKSRSLSDDSFITCAERDAAAMDVGESVLPEPTELDVLLLWDLVDVTDVRRTRVGAHYVCRQRMVGGSVPVRWTVNFPSTIVHNFSVPCPAAASTAALPAGELPGSLADPHRACRAPLKLTLRNCDTRALNLCVEAFDATIETPSSNAVVSITSSANEAGGWYLMRTSGAAPTVDVPGGMGPGLSSPVPGGSVANTPRGRGPSGPPPKASPRKAGASGLLGDPKLTRERLGPVPLGPYMWSGQTRAVIVALPPGKTADVHLQVVFFGPGVYDLSNYRVSWSAVNPTAEDAAPLPSPTASTVSTARDLPPLPPSSTPNPAPAAAPPIIGSSMGSSMFVWVRDMPQEKPVETSNVGLLIDL